MAKSGRIKEVLRVQEVASPRAARLVAGAQSGQGMAVCSFHCACRDVGGFADEAGATGLNVLRLGGSRVASVFVGGTLFPSGQLIPDVEQYPTTDSKWSDGQRIVRHVSLGSVQCAADIAAIRLWGRPRVEGK